MLNVMPISVVHAITDNLGIYDETICPDSLKKYQKLLSYEQYCSLHSATLLNAMISMDTDGI